MTEELRNAIELNEADNGQMTGYVLVAWFEDGSVTADVNVNDADDMALYLAATVEGIMKAGEDLQ